MKSLIVLIVAFSLSMPAYGSTDCLYGALDRLVSADQDSSVELELQMSANVLNILTTENGKVSGLLQGSRVPFWFKRWTKIHNHKDAYEVPWDDLPNEVKIDLLKHISKGRNFKKDRAIPGVRIKEKVVLKFDQPTTFFGKRYTSGEHYVDTSDFFVGPVEYRSSRDVLRVSGVELHFRGNQQAGKMSNDAWVLLNALGIQRNHQHIHVVAKIPEGQLVLHPKEQPALMADFYRRANLAAEMFAIMEEGGQIRRSGALGITYFKSLDKENLKGVTKYFVDLAKGSPGPIGDKFKMAWVGFRGSDKYDSPNLWGLEFRSISRETKPQAIREVLDGLQSSMSRNEFGISLAKMKAWLEKQPSDVDIPTLIARQWYNRPWPQVFEYAPAPIKQNIGLFRQEGLAFLSWKEQAQEYKMLFHNWLNDPLFFDASDEIKKQILDAQIVSIQQLTTGTSRIKVMKNFLRRSGLYKKVMESVGVNVQWE